MNNRLKIFISSTSDLKRWRKAAAEALKNLDVVGNMFENWPASPNNSIEECLLRVRESDALILLIKEKYGTVLSGLSITHHEYRQAIEKGIPIFVYRLPTRKEIDKQTKAFIDEVENNQTGHYRKSIKSTSDLKMEIKDSIQTEMTRRFRQKPSMPETEISDNKSSLNKIVITDIPFDNEQILLTYLLEKYKRGDDEFIYNIYDLIKVKYSTNYRIISICYMSEVNLGLNNYEIRNNVIQEAISLWESRIQQYSNSVLAGHLYNIGNCYHVIANYAKAVEFYNQSLNINNKNPKCLKNLGSVYYQINRYDEALDCFTRAIQLNPQLSEALFSLGVYYIQQKDDLIKGLNYLQRINFDKVNFRIKRLVRMWIIYANIKQKKYHEALNLLKKIELKQDEWINNNISFCYYNLVRISDSWTTEAITYWESYLEDNGTNENAWYELGELCYTLALKINSNKHYEKAINAYNKALEHKIDDPKGILWDHLGHSYFAIDKTDEAINAFNNARLRNIKAYTYCLIQVLVHQGNYKAALPLAIIDAKKYHKDSQSWFQMAICLINLNYSRKGKKALLKSVRLNRNNPYPLYELGGLYWNQGKINKARATWIKAVNRFPEFERSKEVEGLL